MNKFRIAGGALGHVKWAWHVAATIRTWVLSEDGQTISGTLEAPNAAALGQSPLVFVVDAGKGQWRWPIRDLTITGSTVTLTVGPKESR